MLRDALDWQEQLRIETQIPENLAELVPEHGQWLRPDFGFCAEADAGGADEDQDDESDEGEEEESDVAGAAGSPWRLLGTPEFPESFKWPSGAGFCNAGATSVPWRTIRRRSSPLRKPSASSQSVVGRGRRAWLVRRRPPAPIYWRRPQRRGRVRQACRAARPE